MILSLLLSSSLALSLRQDPAQTMLEAATADQPLVHTALVSAPVAEVWKAFTTTEGIKSWMVRSGEVVLRIGGYLRTSYQPDSKLDGPDTIENTILAFDPERMLTIRNSRAPEKFPFKHAIANCWTVIYFEPADGKTTRVTTRMNGFDGSQESMQMKRFFKMGNQETLDSLVKRFAKK